ncbi:hypothetical protein [Pedobacter metabolipauper]|uniref:Uncharacterized protein n=1 Tax=Pedobacter metabolipauper TaxID=425513 RepID=A0A4R6T363_9SPHI|nr:hypothetical protein [Pedobacter metabolipauper]TDQ11811.1 hypothetical protein ATK78_0940 [Pedobacter metabolipauper]
MKFKILTLFAVAAMAFAGCGSDKNGDGDSDSLTTDTNIVDTTSTMSGTTPLDTGTATTPDTIPRDTIPQ